MFVTDHDFKDKKLNNLGERCLMKYQNSMVNKDGRLLIVIEVAGDCNESEWKRLFAASKWCLTNGSKIIITSRSDKITELGTMRTVTLKYLSDEAYWYFFKTLTFGSTDPMMHPRMAYLAMEIARTFKGCIISATVLARFLRDNFDIHFGCKFLVFLRGYIKLNVSKFGEHPTDALNQNKPARLGRMVRTSEEVVVHHQYERSSQEEIPKIALQSVMYGIVKPPAGRFEALAYKSPIPTYYNYIYTCEVRDLKTTSAKRKCS